MKKRIIKIGSIVAGAGLLLGLLLPGVVAAQPQEQGQQQNQYCQQQQQQNQNCPQFDIISGTVASIAQDGKSFVVQKSDQTQVTVNVDENTRYFIGSPQPLREQIKKFEGKMKNLQRGLGHKNGQMPCQDEDDDEDTAGSQDIAPGNAGWLNGLKNRLQLARWAGQGSFSDLAVGQNVVIRLMPNETLAKQVLIIKALPFARVSGTISAVGASSITITKSDSSTITLTWDSNTRFVLRGVLSVQSGQTVNAFYNTSTNLAKLVTVSPPTPAPSTSSTVST